MAAVHLDFVRRDGSRALGVAVLLAGLAGALGASYAYTRADAERAQVEGQLWRLRAPPAPVPKGLAESFAAADRLALQFRRPWEQLFLALEAISLPGVRLTQILPQPAGAHSQLQLSGEADRAEDLYEYLRRLAASGELRDVHLVQQRWDEQSRISQFQLAASWEQAPRPKAAP
ncbi:PilN domain-containing protein [Duganella sp. Root336D2]|uniref:PilN domain-containing protein n=1 Tax=Duganella sp. Root336D2 TaxID=1736518 RepID=UPI0006F7E5C2|nr:PilN domain-containing protein [Duganella sp. Root336D2]KQV59722.1 hypothetical protein ASD07_23170 [Duganella sp. Root336D2]